MSALTAAPTLPAVPAAQRINRRRPDAKTMQIAHRVAGIEIRKELTDSLKRFSDYVDEAGHASSGGPGIYIQLSRRINVTFGLSREAAEAFLQNGSQSLRDTCSIIELLTLQMLEIDLTDMVNTGMREKRSRRDIKQGLYDHITFYGTQYANRFARWREES